MSTSSENFVWPVEFGCTLIIDKLIFPNHYSIRISVEPITHAQPNVANGFKKIRYFIENHLHNAVFLKKTNNILNSLNHIESNLVILPEEPYDYFVGAVLYKKLLSISEKYFDINQITIDSIVGDRVQYHIREPNECGLDLLGEHWWNQDNANTRTGKSKSWNELDTGLCESRFEPKIIKGGLSEGR